MHDAFDPLRNDRFDDDDDVKPDAPQGDVKPAKEEPAHRQVQRRALRDLVSVSVECTTEETAIEDRHTREVEESGKKYEWGKSDVSRRYENLRGTVREKYGTRLKDLTTHHATESNNAASADKKTRTKIDQEHDAVARDVKTKVQQAIWLAESVLEATQIQLRQESKQAKEDLETNSATIDESEIKVVELMDTYGQRVAEPGELPTLPEGVDAAALFATKRTEIDERTAALRSLKLPGFFIGLRPFLVVFVLCLIAGVAAQFSQGKVPSSVADLSTLQPAWGPIGIAVGATLVVLIGLGIFLKMTAKKQIASIYVPLREALSNARAAAERHYQDTKKSIEQRLAEATKKRETEIKTTKEEYAPVQLKAVKTRDAARKTQAAEYAKIVAAINAKRDRVRGELDAWQAKHIEDLKNREAQDLAAHEERYKQDAANIEKLYQDSRAALVERWTNGLAHIQTGVQAEANHGESTPVLWSDPAWAKWLPPKQFSTAIRFGELQVDLQQITDQVPKQLEIPPTFAVPALLAFPKHSSLLVETERTGRPEAIRTMQMVMTRLLTSLPAGRLRFTMIDPVALGQNFSGFMHLGDYDEALVGGHIWTNADEIDQRLKDLTEHMETVIQKYLRNEFATIDDYNEQAGELAEPYRFLVIADFPANFSTEAIARLASISNSGARCGVYTIIMRDTRQSLPTGAHMEDVEAHSVVITREGENFVWKDEVFKQFPLKLDPPPTDEELIAILHKVGKGAKDAKRVEVPFDLIAPKPDQLWTSDSTSDLACPIGRMGATRLQMMRLGRGVAQHALVAGKTGSGKSTLLNAIITNLAMWYSPDQVELFLIDFKKGVEFKTYATHGLPHARAIAVESDREFGLSVLQRLDAELIRRGDMYRKAGSQDLAGYRRSDGAVVMPRMLLIIDEFQEFFSEDDRVAQEASLLLDRLVRQGRAFGVHVMLGSQTIGGAGGLPRTTIGQMAVRVALACSEADSQLILGDNNSAARLLSRPGEAIYNDQGGLVEANSPFQIAYLGDELRERYLDRISDKVKAHGGKFFEPIVFEGNAAADLTKNVLLRSRMNEPAWPQTLLPAQAWLGDPVAIKDPTAIVFRRQSGANVLIIGQQDESALAIMVASMLSIAVQQSPGGGVGGIPGSGGAIFYVLDGTPADSPFAGSFARIAKIIPHEVKQIEFRAVPDALNELDAEMQRRQTIDLSEVPSIYVLVYGLQRYRSLRKSDDSFGGFSTGDEPKKADPGKQFSDLMREGPALGIHTIAWCDTPASVERTLDRTMMRELDHRVLFQMSANDSSNLIDSPAANKLGANRALSYSEEQGVMEKFRPYGFADNAWLEEFRAKLAARPGASDRIVLPKPPVAPPAPDAEKPTDPFDLDSDDPDSTDTAT
jgi:energy-coupling factor transporter ATP-binding protein EcfA2